MSARPIYRSPAVLAVIAEFEVAHPAVAIEVRSSRCLGTQYIVSERAHPEQSVRTTVSAKDLASERADEIATTTIRLRVAELVARTEARATVAPEKPYRVLTRAGEVLSEHDTPEAAIKANKVPWRAEKRSYVLRVADNTLLTSAEVPRAKGLVLGAPAREQCAKGGRAGGAATRSRALAKKARAT